MRVSDRKVKTIFKVLDSIDLHARRGIYSEEFSVRTSMIRDLLRNADTADTILASLEVLDAPVKKKGKK